MNPPAYATRFDRLRAEPAWRLLSANLASDVLGLMRYLLHDGDRVVAGPPLVARLNTELDMLRAPGVRLEQERLEWSAAWATLAGAAARVVEDSMNANGRGC